MAPVATQRRSTIITAVITILAGSGLLFIELKLKRRSVRLVALSTLALVLVIGAINVGIEIGRALQANSYNPHIAALFDHLAGLARENQDNALKRDVLRFKSEMPNVLNSESALAQVVGEIENGASNGNQSPPPSQRPQ